MKKILLSLPVYATLFVTEIAVAQNPVFPSSAVNPAATTFDVNDVNFLNKDTAVAVGTGGLAWQTTDGGQNWSTIATFTNTSDNNAVYMEDEYICIAGNSGLVTFSEDRGLTWQNASAAQSNINYHGVDFADTTFGVAVGENGDAVAFKWNGSSYGWVHAPSGSSKKINAVAAFKTSTDPHADGNAIAVGDHGFVARYSSGSWTIINSGISGNIHGVYLFPDQTTVLAVGEHGMIVRSTDLGNTWTTLNSGATETLHDISEGITASHFVAVGDKGVIYVSEDGGNTFTRCTVGFTTSDLKGVSAKNPRGSFGGSGSTLRSFTDDNISGIQTISKSMFFTVGPNPATNVLKISLAADPGNELMHLYNTRGDLTFSEKIQRGNNSYDISALAPGIYFLVIDGRAAKVVIEN
jgi:photosystem II stability/assembly factor-like uncharacterized protein